MKKSLEDKINATKICSICQVPYTGWGNNAQPVNNKRCCDYCNEHIVIPARFAKYTDPAKLKEMAETAKILADCGFPIKKR